MGSKKDKTTDDRPRWIQASVRQRIAAANVLKGVKAQAHEARTAAKAVEQLDLSFEEWDALATFQHEEQITRTFKADDAGGMRSGFSVHKEAASALREHRTGEYPLELPKYAIDACMKHIVNTKVEHEVAVYVELGDFVDEVTNAAACTDAKHFHLAGPLPEGHPEDDDDDPQFETLEGPIPDAGP